MASGGDLSQIGRLKEEEEKALYETNEKIQQWNKFNEDYTALKSRLTTLPDKVSHEIMVPFGKYAFMPGQLIHTNEILVLLGDNWFAERSAKQACEIINRRKKYVQKMIDDLKKQKYLLESRLGFVSDMKHTAEGMGDMMEIKEEYDEMKEKKWREERRAKKKASAAAQKAETPKSSSSDNVSGIHDNGTKEGEPTAEDLLWARLDELERQEEELDEMEMTDEEEEKHEQENEEEFEEHEKENTGQPPFIKTLHDAHKHVHWQDQDEISNPSLTLNLGPEDDDEEEDEHDEQSTSVIHFLHTRDSQELPRPPIEPEKEDSPRSPADIYELYQARSRGGTGDGSPEEQPKSILKHSDVPPPVDNSITRQQVEEKRQPLPAPLSAFTGNIVEHSQSTQPAMPEPTANPGQGSKRVSKFKAARQGRR